MPNIIIQSQNLEVEGAVIDVQISIIEELKKSLEDGDERTPEPIKCKAQIDTGAQGTVLKPSIISELNLSPVGTTKVNTPTEKGVECFLFPVKMTLPVSQGFTVVLSSITVIQASLEGQDGFDCLIGRDILKHTVLIYTGRTNSFTLCI